MIWRYSSHSCCCLLILNFPSGMHYGTYCSHSAFHPAEQPCGFNFFSFLIVHLRRIEFYFLYLKSVVTNILLVCIIWFCIEPPMQQVLRWHVSAPSGSASRWYADLPVDSFDDNQNTPFFLIYPVYFLYINCFLPLTSAL